MVAPPNDNFANRILITVPSGGSYVSPLINQTDATTQATGFLALGDANVSTSALTAAEQDMARSSNRSAWFEYQPATTGLATFHTTASPLSGGQNDTQIAVWKRRPGYYNEGMTFLANDQDSGPGNTSSVTFTAVAGEIYFLQVGHWNNNPASPVPGAIVTVTGPASATVAGSPPPDVPVSLVQADATDTTLTADWAAAAVSGSKVSAHITVNADRVLAGYSGSFDWQYRLNFAAIDFGTPGVRYGVNIRGITAGPNALEVFTPSTLVHSVGSHTSFGTTPPALAPGLGIEVYRYPDPNGDGHNAQPIDNKASFDAITFPPYGGTDGYWGWTDEVHGRWFFGAKFINDPGSTHDEPAGSATSATALAPAATTSYEYRVDGGAPVNVGLNTDAIITGLTEETTYSVQVRAVNASGPSAWSTAVPMTTELGVLPAYVGAGQVVAAYYGVLPVSDLLNP